MEVSAVAACTLRGMTRARSGPAGLAFGFLAEVSAVAPESSAGDFACTPVEYFDLCLLSAGTVTLEGQTRKLGGPSPELSPGNSRWDGGFPGAGEAW